MVDEPKHFLVLKLKTEGDTLDNVIKFLVIAKNSKI